MPTLNASRRAAVVAIAASWILHVRCESPTALESEFPPDARAFVTGAALANVDRNGHFVFTEPGGRLISAARAETIALAAMAAYAREGREVEIPGLVTQPVRVTLEQRHGRPIDFQRVRTGHRRPFLADSYLQDLPDSIPAAVHNQFGPHYLVPLYSGDVQVVTIAVAAFTRVSIDASGRIQGRVGADYRPIGVPFGAPRMHPESPEAVVIHSAKRFGARVSEVPRLLQPGNRVTPAQAQWTIRFERNVRVRMRSGGAVVETRTIYVGQFPSIIDDHLGVDMELRFFVAADDQPATETVRYIVSSDVAEFRWPLKQDHPVDFLEVAPQDSLDH